jgi:hypothetical protein
MPPLGRGCSSRFFRSSCRIGSASALDKPARFPGVDLGLAHPLCVASRGQPNFAATELSGAHYGSYSCPCSRTNLTARSRTSRGYGLRFPIGQSSSRDRPSEKAGGPAGLLALKQYGPGIRALGVYLHVFHYLLRGYSGRRQPVCLPSNRGLARRAVSSQRIRTHDLVRNQLGREILRSA